MAQAKGESQFRFRVWWGEKEACWMELTSPFVQREMAINDFES